MWIGLFFAFLVLGHSKTSQACAFPDEPPGLGTFHLSPEISGLNRPIKFLPVPGPNQPEVVLEQYGKIKVFATHQSPAQVVLDLTSVVTNPDQNNEGGLLGMAFHPAFAQNRRVFLNYTFGSDMKSRISEFRMEQNYSIPRSSEKVILEIPQPYSNHNGGEVAFGPDGFLYIGMGDGGSAGDPQNNAQNMQSLLGKMLRIDVDRGSPYSIPTDNPFVDRPNIRQEIYAYGLRNPWRFSFDRATGALWAGDVGQNRLEEIDVIKKGGNYGWRVMEGSSCYRPGTGCDQSGLELPVVTYGRSLGVSVTGGFVYRGKAIPALVGTYIYGDFQSGNIWGLRYENNAVIDNKILLESGVNISAFGEDHNGEIYVVDHGGRILKLNHVSNPAPSSFPLWLSLTRCFTSTSPLVPAPRVISYEVNTPLWSDGAVKTRWAYFPPGTKVEAFEDAPWNFPQGSVFIKNFYIPQKTNDQIQNKLVETRFLVLKETGVKGYTYKWNPEGTDAEFLGGAAVAPTTIHDQGRDESFAYYFPSSTDCQRCHSDAKGKILGFGTAQLNQDSGGENQITSFRRYDWFDDSSLSPDVPAWPKLVDYRDSNFPVDQRMRSFLEVQCSTCHNPQTPTGQARMNLSADVLLTNMGVCNTPPRAGDLGVSSTMLLTPGHPERSMMYLRFASQNLGERMPPLATSRNDPAALRLMNEWISGLQSCQ